MNNNGKELKKVKYEIGSIGPAGGLIFYGKRSFSDGWRYLEAAPFDTEFTAEWGTFHRNVSDTSKNIGSGRKNMQLILALLTGNNERGRAAQMVTQLNVNGFSDWFLPGKNELNLMYRNLKTCGLGGFNDKLYWSSSQNNNFVAWAQRFSDGVQPSNTKSNRFSVRAVRAF